MKKLILALCAGSVLILAGCGAKKNDNKPVITILERKPDPAPRWVNDPNWKVVKQAGVKTIFFKIETSRPTLDKAKGEAQLNKSTYLANIIKQFTSSEMVKAVEGMLNDKGEMDIYFSDIAATISRNANTSGTMPAGEYYEYILESTKATNINYYHYILRVSLDYEDLQKRILDATKVQESVIKAKLPDPTQDITAKMKESMDKEGEE